MYIGQMQGVEILNQRSDSSRAGSGRYKMSDY